MARQKFKVLSTTRGEWDQVVTHARSLGAFSRDNQYAYRSDKSAMTITPDNRILYSSPDMKPTSGPAPVKISVREFLSFTSLNDIEKPVGANSGVAVASAVAASMAVCDAMIQEVIDESPCSQDTLVVKKATVLTQNALLWKTVGLPKLKSLGIDVTMDGDVAYVIDIASNTATELTAEFAAKQAKADLEANDGATAYTIYAKDMELISELVMTKKVD